MTDRTLSFSTHRIMLSRVFAVIILTYILAFGPLNGLPRWSLLASEIVGYLFLATAALGRIWCLLFIAGKKNKILTTEGPYSIVRNPLYIFSFIGVIGFGLAVENPALAITLTLFFAVFYPSVVHGEEKHLKELYGSIFDDYCDKTPRWIPNFLAYHEPDSIEVDPLRFRRGILDAMWFLWAFLLWEVLEGLHDLGIVPHWF